MFGEENRSSGSSGLSESLDELLRAGTDVNRPGGIDFRRQQGERLNILTKKQMLSRLPIPLAQIQAENNSQKLKNELRQLIYSLYRSKALTKTVCNNLIKVI